MRLIDADLLLFAMDSRYNEKKDSVPDILAEGFMQMETLIKEQPTAYDADKVVDELQKTGNSYCANVHCDMECLDCEHGIMMRKIVDIVRGGKI